MTVHAEHPNATDWRNRCERAEQALEDATRELDTARAALHWASIERRHADRNITHLRESLDNAYQRQARTAIREARERAALIGAIAALLTWLLGFAAGLSYASL